MPWTSQILYKKTPSGKIRTWAIAVDRDEWWTLTGDYQGDVRSSEPKKCTEKNVGSANYRDANQVALDTAKSQVEKRLKEEYVASLAELEEQAKIPRAMLARPHFEKEKKRIEKAIAQRKCYVQPKLDGFRCLASRTGLWTRNLRKITTCEHIEDALEPMFEANPYLVLDGELYNHDYRDDFGKLQSLITKENVGLFDGGETSELIQFHVYDTVFVGVFVKRYMRVMQYIPADHDFLKRVRTVRVKSMEGIAKYHSEFVEQGYEGTMVRTSTTGYEQEKRPAQLVKLKNMQDEEFVIVDMNEGQGQWAGACKSITCRVPGSEQTFDAGCRGSMPILSAMLKRKKDYIGGKATIQFQSKFPTGKPRFPVATKYFVK